MICRSFVRCIWCVKRDSTPLINIWWTLTCSDGSDGSPDRQSSQPILQTSRAWHQSTLCWIRWRSSSFSPAPPHTWVSPQLPRWRLASLPFSDAFVTHFRPIDCIIVRPNQSQPKEQILSIERRICFTFIGLLFVRIFVLKLIENIWDTKTREMFSLLLRLFRFTRLLINRTVLSFPINPCFC